MHRKSVARLCAVALGIISLGAAGLWVLDNHRPAEADDRQASTDSCPEAVPVARLDKRDLDKPDLDKPDLDKPDLDKPDLDKPDKDQYHPPLPKTSLPTRDPQPVEPATLQQAIHLAADYLVGACRTDGQFVYRINLNPEVRLEPKYNMLRHAGAIYALGMYQQRYPRQPIRDAMVRAAGFLRRTAVAPVPENGDLLAVWSYPEVSGTDGPLQAKLGGTGLGLVALLSLEEIQPGSTSLEELRSLGRFLVFMQKEDGSFYSKYVPSEAGRSDAWISLYYPGEAALGLLMLYEKDPSPVWLRAAAKGLAYLARIRASKRLVEADHWALVATAKLLTLAERGQQPFPREAALQHALAVCESILADIPRYPPMQIADGCLTGDARTCPTATRLEGLLAASRFLPEQSGPLRARITSVAEGGISFLLRCQIRSGRYAGGITRAIPPPAGNGQFQHSSDPRATEVRIDYVQHALSAMIEYERMFCSPAATGLRGLRSSAGRSF